MVLALDTLGLAAISAGGFVVETWLGLIIVGLSLLAMSWLLTSSS